MAKTSMKVKQRKPAKYSTREYNRCKICGRPHAYLRKYGENKTQVITGLRRVSKPGLRIYSNVEEMPKVMKGLGIAIVSTSKGIMTDREARKLNVGGEVLAFVW